MTDMDNETSIVLASVPQNVEDKDTTKFQGVGMNDVPTVEDLNKPNTFLHDIDYSDKTLVGEFARTSPEKPSNTVKFLR